MNLTAPPHWGERSSLLPKKLIYVFSMDVGYLAVRPDAAYGPAPPPIGIALIAEPSSKVSTYHVLDEDFVTTPDGVLREVPKARVKSGDDMLIVQNENGAPVDARLVFDTDGEFPLTMKYTGVINGTGGTKQLYSAAAAGNESSASVYIAATQEIPSPKYRWLVYNQLVGVGQVTAKLTDARVHLSFSFDLYIAS